MDARVTIVHQPNGDPSVARNTGLGSSREKFITFIDSDNWVSPNYIEVLLKMIRRADVEIAIGSFLKVHDPSEQTISHSKFELETLIALEALTGLYGQREVQMAIVWANYIGGTSS